MLSEHSQYSFRICRGRCVNSHLWFACSSFFLFFTVPSLSCHMLCDLLQWRENLCGAKTSIYNHKKLRKERRLRNKVTCSIYRSLFIGFMCCVSLLHATPTHASSNLSILISPFHSTNAHLLNCGAYDDCNRRLANFVLVVDSV